MKTSVERVDETTVKLSVTVGKERVEEALDHVAGHLAEQINVPGFRKGRVPRRVLESRIGKEALAQEAVREFLPAFYEEAAREEGLEVVGPPEFDVETFERGRDATFSATVPVRPEFDAPDLSGLRIPHPEWEPTDAEIDARIDGTRERFATVETVEGAADVGSLAVVTVRITVDGEEVTEAGVEDTLHEIQAPEVSDARLDRELIGASAGAILKFTDEMGPDTGEYAGKEAEVTAIVKEVKRKTLPEPDDDFALTASEFDTIAEFRDDVRAELAGAKKAHARQELRGKVVEAVAELVEIPLPEAMIQSEQRFRLERMLQQAQQFGMELDQFLEAIGTDQQGLVEQLETEARQTVKAQLVVDRIGNAEGIEIEQSDLGEEIARQAMRLRRPPEELAQVMTSSPERISALAADAFRRKTIDLMIERVEILAGPPDDDDEDEMEAADAEDGVEDGEAAALLAADAAGGIEPEGGRG